MPFAITDYITFGSNGRAACPSCTSSGKKETNTNLSLLESGAYKCFRGCTTQEIREAVGYRKDRTVTPPAAPPEKPAGKVTVTPAKVREATDRLLNQSTHALGWLAQRGITPEMIQHFRLGVVRCKVTPTTWAGAISIPIPANSEGTLYFQKKRVKPWEPGDHSPWSQYGIPRMVYFTHQAQGQAQQTWLCEGEWDAHLLGWQVKNSPELAKVVSVATFTCGAGNVPPAEILADLQGLVVIFYDRDQPGEAGAGKVAQALGDRARIAQVPALEDPPPAGWDISDAIQAGLFGGIAVAAEDARPWSPPPKDNPLRSRLQSNDQLLDTAPDYTDWLVDEILTADELFLLAASPRAGKSLLAFTLSKAVATGEAFLGRPVAQGAVIYIRCEDSATKTKERQLKQGWGRGLPVWWLESFKLSELAHLEALVEELGARLVVFDTLSRIRDASSSENSAEMSQLLEPIQELCKKHRTTGLLVHHTGKVNTTNAGDVEVFDSIRGSSSIRATCRGTMVLAADESSYRLCVENGWGKHDLKVLLDAHTLEWKLLGNWQGPNVDLNQKDQVLNFLNQVQAAQLQAISEATNLPKRSLYEVLKRLQADGLIEKRGDRQAAIYARKGIQQIQLLNSLLN